MVLTLAAENQAKRFRHGGRQLRAAEIRGPSPCSAGRPAPNASQCLA